MNRDHKLTTRAILIATTSLLLIDCHRRDTAGAAGSRRSVPKVDQTVTESVRQPRPDELWPVPKRASRIDDHMWALTLVPGHWNLRPKRRSRTQLVYEITSYDETGKIDSGPSVRIVQLEYTPPRWQPLFLQMVVGETRRVWLSDTNEPRSVYDVELRNIIGVD